MKIHYKNVKGALSYPFIQANEKNSSLKKV